MDISGTYRINENLTALIDITVTDYGNESSARNALSNIRLSCSPGINIPITDTSVMHREGDGKTYCYTFYTDLFAFTSPENLTSYRVNKHFKYLKQEVYGQYLISIGVDGNEYDDGFGHYLYYDGYYKGNYIRKNASPMIQYLGNRTYWVTASSVSLTVLLVYLNQTPTSYSDNVTLHLTVDGKAYSSYISNVEGVYGMTRSFSVQMGNAITSRIISLLLNAAAPPGSTPKNSPKVEIISPRDGAALDQLFDGYFTLSLRALVDGAGASNLYAVVTLPDGSEKRESVIKGTVMDILDISNPPSTGGTVRVDLYGKVNGTTTLLASDSVGVSFVSEEVPGDNIDNDGDGLVDCDDPDIATCDACVLQKKLEWAESLMERHIDYINRMIEHDPSMKSVYTLYIDHLHEIHDQYKDDPEGMVKEMNAYMEEKVYRNREVNGYLSIFKDDPEKRYQLRQIAEKYRYDPIMRRIKMKRFIYENSESEAEREATMNAILTGILEPPKWLVGGQYGSGGALDWANFVASNFEKVGDTIKLKGTGTVKILRTPVNVYLVAQDARALMKQAEELKKMNLPENTRVSIIVLDGATKIGKLLDPTGYFGNMADATIGSLVDLRKKIEERNQGWFTWNGYVLHETAKPGIYEDYETGRKFKRVSGGWFSNPTFIEVKENG
nr:hypothetical protein [Thermococcus sp. Bubb.Bath]